MANYPNTPYEPRAIENVPGVTFNSDDKKTLFAEDINQINDEIKAIEDNIPNAKPLGADYGFKISDAESLIEFLDTCSVHFEVLDEVGAKKYGGAVTLDKATGILRFGSDEVYYQIESMTIDSIVRPVLVPYYNGQPFANAMRGNITLVANPDDHYAMFQMANSDGTLGPNIAYNEEANSVNFQGNVVLYNFQGAGLAIAQNGGGYMFLTEDYAKQAQMQFYHSQDHTKFQTYGYVGTWEFQGKLGVGKLPVEVLDVAGNIKSEGKIIVENKTDGAEAVAIEVTTGAKDAEIKLTNTVTEGGLVSILKLLLQHGTRNALLYNDNGDLTVQAKNNVILCADGVEGVSYDGQTLQVWDSDLKLDTGVYKHGNNSGWSGGITFMVDTRMNAGVLQKRTAVLNFSGGIFTGMTGLTGWVNA